MCSCQWVGLNEWKIYWYIYIHLCVAGIYRNEIKLSLFDWTNYINLGMCCIEFLQPLRKWTYILTLSSHTVVFLCLFCGDPAKCSFLRHIKIFYINNGFKNNSHVLLRFRCSLSHGKVNVVMTYNPTGENIYSPWFTKCSVYNLNNLWLHFCEIFQKWI